MPGVSIVIVAHNMARELPRTVFSALPPYQRHVPEWEAEVIVIDNGSDVPVTRESLGSMVPDDAPVKVMNFPPGNPSPVAAINQAVGACRSEWIGVMIDGARILSPGIMEWLALAARLFDHPFVHTMAAHLGPDIQQVSTKEGYDQAAEDRVLEEAGWREDGYRLFTVSVPAPSSRHGWPGPIAESNAFFLRKSDYNRLGGFEEKFTGAGGGLANLDFFRRAMESDFLQPVCLVGESTFHQVHGGITINHSPEVDRDKLLRKFFDEYAGLRNESYRMSTRDPVLLGALRSDAAAFARHFHPRP